MRPLRADYPPLDYAVDGGNVVIEFGPVDFIQVNREINVSMVDAAMRLLQPQPDDTVLDLFCGLGNFTLPLARRARRVVGVEGDAALVAKARANAVRNGIGNAAFLRSRICSSRRSFGAWANERYDLVLLDPPRAGAAAAAGAAWRIGVRGESCIFPAIQGVWRGMRRSWSHDQGFRLTAQG